MDHTQRHRCWGSRAPASGRPWTGNSGACLRRRLNMAGAFDDLYHLDVGE